MHDPRPRHPRTGRLLRAACGLAAVAAAAPALADGHAATAPAVAEAPPADPFKEALLGGTFDFNLRARYEFAEVGALDTSNALTTRVRLGYTTQEFAGFQASVQLEANQAFDESLYNAAGLNGQPGRSVIADPEDAEFNQGWISYDLGQLLAPDGEFKAKVKAGRQRINLDDQRFVGAVGWRQLEQTFDAVTFTATPMEGLDVFYSYILEVNRIFGQDAGRNFDSENTHLINVAYSGLEIGKIVGFIYLLDFDNAPALSSQTYGGRISGTKPLDDTWKIAYSGSVATQSDFGNNPTSYDALYGALEARFLHEQGWFVGGGAESLGSDESVAAFSTPLATLHKFNGYADSFLATPAGGLRDYYATIGTKLPEPFKGKAFVTGHYFTGQDNSNELGYEIDAVAFHNIDANQKVLMKYAYYDGDGGRADIQRFWVQYELTF
ncbi:MAG: alginate export family protein [Planctomycetota bacterium]